MIYPQSVLILGSFIFGAVIGSFLNVVILRLPKEEKLTGSSRCPLCGHNLSAGDLFPFFSYLFLLGKCRYCRGKISPRYFIIELLTGLLFVCCYVMLPLQSAAGFVLLLKYFFAVSIFLVIFVIDLEHFLILDTIVFTGLITVTLLNLAHDLLNHQFLFGWQSMFFGGIIAAILSALPFFLIWYFSSGEWMGFGDVKLALLLGVILGPQRVFVGIMLGVLLGGLVSVLLLIFSKKTLRSALPFGTFLTLGSLVALFYGDKLLSWYLSFLGF